MHGHRIAVCLNGYSGFEWQPIRHVSSGLTRHRDWRTWRDFESPVTENGAGDGQTQDISLNSGSE